MSTRTIMAVFKRSFVCLLCLLLLAFGPGLSASASTEQELNEVTELWEGSIHALNDVNCASCHENSEKEFVALPDQESCRSCHEQAVDTFLLSKHGVRLLEGESALTPKMSRLPMHSDAMQSPMNCNSCHNVHSVNTIEASVDACLSSHNDNHSLNYSNSRHAALFEASKDLPRPGPGAVSCATCHLPRIPADGSDAASRLSDFDVVHVNHNNTYNLKPQDRMVGDVCMNCHGIEHSFNSIFDPELVEANFDRPPTLEMETFDLMKAAEKRRSGNASE